MEEGGRGNVKIECRRLEGGEEDELLESRSVAPGIGLQHTSHSTT